MVATLLLHLSTLFALLEHQPLAHAPLKHRMHIVHERLEVGGSIQRSRNVDIALFAILQRLLNRSHSHESTTGEKMSSGAAFNGKEGLRGNATHFSKIGPRSSKPGRSSSSGVELSTIVETWRYEDYPIMSDASLKLILFAHSPAQRRCLLRRHSVRSKPRQYRCLRAQQHMSESRTAQAKHRRKYHLPCLRLTWF